MTDPTIHEPRESDRLAAEAIHRRIVYGLPVSRCSIISRIIAKHMSEERERAERMEKALRGIVSVRFSRECKHGEESWYCDSCRVDWEKELGAALAEARAALEGKP